MIRHVTKTAHVVGVLLTLDKINLALSGTTGMIKDMGSVPALRYPLAAGGFVLPHEPLVYVTEFAGAVGILICCDDVLEVKAGFLRGLPLRHDVLNVQADALEDVAGVASSVTMKDDPAIIANRYPKTLLSVRMTGTERHEGVTIPLDAVKASGNLLN